MFMEYLLQNWSLLLILPAFAIALDITVFLDKKTIRRMFFLIGFVFLLSIFVFAEFNVPAVKDNRIIRAIFMAIRYSSTPLIIAQIIYTFVKKQNRYIFIPAILLTVIDFISIPTGIVFKIAEDNSFSRGALGYLPFITVGLYAIALVVLLIKRSNKKWMEIAPIIFLCIALLSQVIFPFVYGSDFSKVFCPTLGIALFIYYVFEILQQTKKDSLTGLLNRNAFKMDISNNTENITALISLDMNGLKALNDTQGHHAGDEALLTLALCMNRALKRRQYAYRIGGDEFAIICQKASEKDVSALVSRIKSNISETKYHCSIGFCYCEDKARDIEDMLRKSDMMMYDDKKRYYEENNLKSR